MDRIFCMRMFARVVELGSFARASEEDTFTPRGRVAVTPLVAAAAGALAGIASRRCPSRSGSRR